MQTIELPQDWQGESAIFIEGAILAANLAVKPLEPEHWCQQVGVDKEQATTLLVARINQQYNMLKRSEYSLLNLDESQLADLAEGFMSVWPTIEVQYQEIQLLDSTLRMLQALLTTFMLAIDEQQTQQQMRESGIDNPPNLQNLLPQLDVMLAEVALAADEQMIGAQGQNINPYKNVGRNDMCPCGTGKKFKQCCGK
ncbi:SEC-C metal-binding domain-containing protein [Vibrio sp. MA40-2]|uniref:SEC-C metal-binding domain-containing protein n=1 Tax=Vibrio sp. MA40-2 TaxID=3391828 RepID=UPI0039A623E4